MPHKNFLDGFLMNLILNFWDLILLLGMFKQDKFKGKFTQFYSINKEIQQFRSEFFITMFFFLNIKHMTNKN